MISLIAKLLHLLNFKGYLDRRRGKKRRANYEFLKSEITRRHLLGFSGLTVDFAGRKFDAIDLQCFRPPMYQIARNKDQKYCIFWHSKKMSEEIGGSVVESQPSPAQITSGPLLQDVERSGI